MIISQLDGTTGWILFGLWTLANWLVTRWLLRRFERWSIAKAEARRRDCERIGRSRRA